MKRDMVIPRLQVPSRHEAVPEHEEQDVPEPLIAEGELCQKSIDVATIEEESALSFLLYDAQRVFDLYRFVARPDQGDRVPEQKLEDLFEEKSQC